MAQLQDLLVSGAARFVGPVYINGQELKIEQLSSAATALRKVGRDANGNIVLGDEVQVYDGTYS